MTLYTLPLNQAENRLHDLVQRARKSPVVLTAGDSAEPLALLLDAQQFTSVTDDNAFVLKTRLSKLDTLLTMLRDNWDNVAIRKEFPNSWRWQLEGVWEASFHREQPFRQLVLLLQLAADDLDMAHFTHPHLELWQRCVEQLHQLTVTSAELAECDRALSDNGFPIHLSFDEVNYEP